MSLRVASATVIVFWVRPSLPRYSIVFVQPLPSMAPRPFDSVRGLFQTSIVAARMASWVALLAARSGTALMAS